MASKRVALTSTLKDKAQNVLNELGQNALSSGYWNNGLGQMGIYVNEAGIHILTGSKNAIAFTRDVTHAYRIKAADADGSLEAIENSLFANGSVDVEIFLNINNTDYEIDSAGNTIFKPSSDMSVQAQAILANIVSQNYAKGIKNQQYDFSSKPIFRANIDRTAFYALIESDDVRAVRPVGYKDTKIAQWPEEVIEAAKEHGEAEIIISLRGGEIFSPKTGYMPEAAIKAQARANQLAFEDILTKADAPVPLETSATTNMAIGICMLISVLNL